MQGDRLRKQREINGLTQPQLARLVGVTKQQIYRWETDKNDPPGDAIMLLAKQLGCSADYLLGLSDYPIPLDNQDLTETENELIAAIRGGDPMSAIAIIIDMFKMD